MEHFMRSTIVPASGVPTLDRDASLGKPGLPPFGVFLVHETDPGWCDSASWFVRPAGRGRAARPATDAANFRMILAQTPLGSGDAAFPDHRSEQAQVGQIEMHGTSRFR